MKSLLLILSAFSLFATASITEEGSGIIFGSDHAFQLKAPKGWMLDNESAVDQGAHAVFYEKGGSWKNSKVVAYAQARAKSATIKTAEDVAQDTIKSFHAKGSEGYQGKLVKTLKSSDGKQISIYHYSGDRWGNFEAAAYIVEDKTINYVVLNARNEKLFQAALPAFEALAQSYTFISDHLDIQKGEPAPKAPPADAPQK